MFLMKSANSVKHIYGFPLYLYIKQEIFVNLFNLRVNSFYIYIEEKYFM